MKQSINLPDGVKIEETANGFVVISNDGKETEFDNTGSLIKSSSSIKEYPSWLKYFFKMGQEERKTVIKWYYTQKGKTQSQRNFLKKVYTALKVVDYDYEIATLEPSVNKCGKLYYAEYKPICVGLTCREWVKKAREFAPEYESDLANLEELFLWYAYRIAKGYWTLSYVCDNSSTEGNYWQVENASHAMEPSGTRCVGGYKDGVGNTFKIVRELSGFALCGGYFDVYSIHYPVADTKCYEGPEYFCDYGVGVVTLRR